MEQGTASYATPQPAGRVTPRVLEVDALRGFALGGIFVVNVLAMAGPYYGGLGDPGASGADTVATWLVVAFAQAKFYLLFSFLFGYSFTLQMTSAERAGARFGPRMVRRLAGLLVLGMLHAALLYTGDILMAYALFGLILLAARRVSPEKAWRIARRIYLTATAVLLFIGLGAMLDGPEPDSALLAEAAELTEAYRGSAADVIGANVGQWAEILLATVLTGGYVVAAFLVGLAAGKRELLARAAEHPERLRRICVVGAVVGVPGALFMAVGSVGPLPVAVWEFPAMIVGMAMAPALSAAYGAGFLLWVTRAGRGPRTTGLGALLAGAGRMSLTNYLTQSLVMALVFTGYGFGLYGKAGAAAAVCGALVVYAAQLALSVRLLRRFRMGPVEWVLRAVTLAGRPSKSTVSRGR
ncbi:DUF418 domain-containing protein [Streptomyces sp. E11-3]|uniref:DUF418 domain-containing protein n=1 Tax=Streptomyces sp. E11-3 TaxID=3110112 RepID=UPI0039813153